MDRKQKGLSLFLYYHYSSLVLGAFLAAPAWSGDKERRMLLAGILLLLCSGFWICHVRGKGALLPVWMMIAVLCGGLKTAAGRGIFGDMTGLSVSWKEMGGLFLLAAVSYGAVYLRLGVLAAAGAAAWVFVTVPPGAEMALFLLFSHLVGSQIFAGRKKEEIPAADRGAGMALVLLAAVLGIGALIPAGYREKLTDSAVIFHQHVIRRLVKSGLLDGSEGRINGGNNLPMGEEQMEITMTGRPEETVYLKNYTAGDYLENRWEIADESGFHEALRQPDAEGKRRYYSSVEQFEGRQHEALYYGHWEQWTAEHGGNWNPEIQQRYREWTEIKEITIRPLEGHGERYMVPYLSGYFYNVEGGRYQYLWYPWKKYEEYLTMSVPRTREMMRLLEEPYAEYAKETYVRVPGERLPELSRLVRNHPLSEVDEISDFIRRTLRSRASYSLTPGVMPLGEKRDIAEYFLFGSGKGYCQHFATTATLLYRLYGIPARMCPALPCPQRILFCRRTEITRHWSRMPRSCMGGNLCGQWGMDSRGDDAGSFGRENGFFGSSGAEQGGGRAGNGFCRCTG